MVVDIDFGDGRHVEGFECVGSRNGEAGRVWVARDSVNWLIWLWAFVGEVLDNAMTGRRFIYMVDALVDLDVCSSARGVVSLHRHLNKRGTARSAVGTGGVRGTFRSSIEPIICRAHRGP